MNKYWNLRTFFIFLFFVVLGVLPAKTVEAQTCYTGASYTAEQCLAKCKTGICSSTENFCQGQGPTCHANPAGDGSCLAWPGYIGCDCYCAVKCESVCVDPWFSNTISHPDEVIYSSCGGIDYSTGELCWKSVCKINSAHCTGLEVSGYDSYLFCNEDLEYQTGFCGPPTWPLDYRCNYDTVVISDICMKEGEESGGGGELPPPATPIPGGNWGRTSCNTTTGNYNCISCAPSATCTYTSLEECTADPYDLCNIGGGGPTPPPAGGGCTPSCSSASGYYSREPSGYDCTWGLVGDGCGGYINCYYNCVLRPISTPTPACSPVSKIDGRCGVNDMTCVAGNPVDNGQRTITGVGIYDLWNCLGIDGSCPVVAANDIGCSAVDCLAVDGGWSSWSVCSGCSQSRTCTNPSPDCGGDLCVGSSTQSCGTVNGDCGVVTNTCDFGTASVGTTQVVVGGINNVWTCNGLCGGINSPVCSATRCTNEPVVNGACNSNILGTTPSDLCLRGTPVYDTKDGNHDYINDSNESEYVWGCEGSTNTCAEGDGTDQLNCTSTIDQRSWYQVNNGSILAKGKVTNYVPITTCTASGRDCASTVNNGGIYTKLSSSVSGFDQAQKTDEGNFSFKIYAYSQLKSDYFESKGVGSTFVQASDTWSKIKAVTGVVFVDGDLEINEDLDTNSFVMVIARGTITINPKVNIIDAILVGNKIVAATNDDSSTVEVNQLVINGMVHGVSNVEFVRSMYPKSLNNASPAVVVNYKPELLFMIPVQLIKAFSQWKIN